MPLNINWKKEFLVLIMGPIFQNIAYVILNVIFKRNYLVKMFHLGILKFNLLPIYPLDGGKLLSLIFNFIIPYKKSLQLTILISYIVTIFILFNYKVITINVIITYILLVYLIRKEELKIAFQYNKFLLERYLNQYNYKKSIIIKNENNFFRLKNNIIKKNGILYSENEFLKRKYNNFKKNY